MSEEFDHCQPHVTLPTEGCDLLDVAEQILMTRFEVDAERAHILLVRAAHHSRMKLFDVCTKVRDARYGGDGQLSLCCHRPSSTESSTEPAQRAGQRCRSRRRPTARTGRSSCSASSTCATPDFSPIPSSKPGRPSCHLTTPHETFTPRAGNGGQRTRPAHPGDGWAGRAPARLDRAGSTRTVSP